jgi:hypothetical protein
LAPDLKMAFVVHQENYKRFVEGFIEKMKDISWEIKIFDRFDLAYEWAVPEPWESL